MLANVKTHRQMFPSEQCVPWLLACEQQKYELFKTIHILWLGFSKPVNVPTKSSFLAEHKGTAAVWAKKQATLLLGWFCISSIDFFKLSKITLQIHKQHAEKDPSYALGIGYHCNFGVLISVCQASCLEGWVKSYPSLSQVHLSE